MKKIDIYEVLKKKIIENEYAPGDVLNEIEISKEFNISRTPVRTAFQRLEMDMLINIVPRYGVQVSFIDFKTMGSLFDLTRVLDPMATRTALKRISNEDIEKLKKITDEIEALRPDDDYKKAIILDEAFHSVILGACDNPWLVNTVKSLHIHTERLWHFCREYFTDLTIFSRTFKKIIEAMENKDEDATEEYSRKHIDEFVTLVKSALL